MVIVLRGKREDIRLVKELSHPPSGEVTVFQYE